MVMYRSWSMESLGATPG